MVLNQNQLEFVAIYDFLHLDKSPSLKKKKAVIKACCTLFAPNIPFEMLECLYFYNFTLPYLIQSYLTITHFELSWGFFLYAESNQYMSEIPAAPLMVL